MSFLNSSILSLFIFVSPEIDGIIIVCFFDLGNCKKYQVIIFSV
ncbi:hypothetical protein GMES_2808 [Paraglaciecola mesophila KMM 241]|uniref:Uncharacterized protein n=1 Tax=Paraglaciecola mesophila KMM 241 TaxID=1128912 RepID=K6Z7Y2_9ALTE|nr:hypothetical protein GMES_2808 [Paraglaciecola mesophila KMM 241]